MNLKIIQEDREIASNLGLQTVTTRPWTRFYPSDIPPIIDYPKEPLFKLLSESAKKHPDWVAISYHGKQITYKELDELANQFANGLISIGIQKGSKVALILPNVPQYVFCFFGILKSGATVVPCNPLYREKEIEFQLVNSEAEAVVLLNNIVGQNNFYLEFEKCRPRLTKLKHVFVTSVTDYLPPIKKQLAGPVRKIRTLHKEGTTKLTDFIRNQPRSEPDLDSVIDPKNDVAVIQYTGGTTGISKGAMLTHENIVSNSVIDAHWTGISEKQETLLAVIPFFHIYGLTIAMNAAIFAGQKIVLLPTFNPKEVLETIQKERVQIFPGVPTMYVALLHHPELKKYSIGSVERCVSGGAPLPLEVQRKFNQATGGNIVEGYGLTEASPVTHINILRPNAVKKEGSIGIPIPNTDAKIVDVETGTKDIPVGEAGELAIRGPQVMKGYWKSDEETKKVLTEDWLLTGDIAKQDEDGFFFIIDRKKDLINASGFKVWPREVEEVLFTHPDVKEAAVIGVPDEYRGETIKAFIVLKDKSNNPGAEAIKAFCKERIAAYKVPKLIEFVDDLPKSLVGKVLRRKLREKEALRT
jgi:long-chain acyl-CoA synthetase